MKSSDTSSLFLSSINCSMKRLQKGFYSFGYFYKKHWEIFVFSKIVVVAILFGIFSVPGLHKDIYAGDSCGNSLCEQTSDYCSVSDSACKKISTEKCVAVAGCSTVTNDVYTCSGTNFSCAGVGDKDTCGKLGCFRDVNGNGICSNDDGKGKTISETCNSLGTSVCSLGGGAVGDCFLVKSGTLSTCEGTITTPKDYSSCNDLNTIIKGFGLSSTWVLGYDEHTTCPQDCNEGPSCGDAVCDNIVNSCVVNTTDCKNLFADQNSCGAISGCSVEINTSGTCGASKSNPGGTFACSSLTSDVSCGAAGCTWKNSACISPDGKDKSCSAISNSVSCALFSDYCSWNENSVSHCTGTIATGSLTESACTLLGSYGYTASWTGEYIENESSCPSDCSGAGSFCGDGTIDDGEKCDDGNSKDGDGCSSSCITERTYVNYAASGDISIVMGNDIAYDKDLKKFVVPTNVSVFTFKDGETLLGYGNGSFYFLIPYTPKGSITILSPKNGIGWTSEYNVFTLAYSGSLNYPIDSFTFTDNSVSTQATYINGVWKFSVLSSSICGNNIVEQGESCDDGIYNGKPGQCNNSCEGKISYNGSCGDGVCKSHCSIDTTVGCKDLNTSDSKKALCTSVGCFLQKTTQYECAGTVQCEKITKSAMYNDSYMVEKYCNIAGCSYNSKSGLCTTPEKQPNCGIVPAAEYCKMLSPMGCTLTTDGIVASCVGNSILNTSSLNEEQCTTAGGEWNYEDGLSCADDCKSSCPENETNDCSSLGNDICEDYFSDSKACIIGKGGSCTIGSSACTTCGNGVCNSNETYTSCPSDCIKASDLPTISYTPQDPKNGGLVSGPVTATLSYGEGCKVLNNDGKTTYSFKYNGYFIFKVTCPWFENKVLDIGAKVFWIENTTKSMANLNDLTSTSGSALYCETINNFVGEVAANDTGSIEMAKKAIYQQSLLAPNTSLKAEFSDKVTLSGNIYFANGASTLSKIELEKTLSGTASKASVLIPEGVTVKVESNGKTSDFNGLFLAPTLANDTIKTKLENQAKASVASVVKIGDEENQKLTLVKESDENEAEEFIISLQFPGYKEGQEVEIFSSQDGDTWTSYGFAEVGKDGYVTFAVPHLTYYGVTVENETTPETPSNTVGSSAGGAGGSVLKKDICPISRDCSDSYYDQLCGPCSSTGDTTNTISGNISLTAQNEQLVAYQYAFLNRITTMPYAQARLSDGITRSELAKMIVNFAQKVSKKSPDSKKSCIFSDNIYGTDEDKKFVVQACQMGLMGLESDGITPQKTFNPTSYVTRAEFGTVFSRLLYGSLYNTENSSSVPYFSKHLSALKKNNVMKKIDTPFDLEIRGFVMIMMLRSDLNDDGILTIDSEDTTPGIGQKIIDFLNDTF